MTYNGLTRRHFETAAQAGELAGEHTRRGAAGRREQGTWVQFDLQFDDGGARATVRAARFRAFGCPHVIAVCDWLAERAPGLSVPSDLASSRLPEPVTALRTRFEVPIEKMGRLLIIEDAWNAAFAPP